MVARRPQRRAARRAQTAAGEAQPAEVAALEWLAGLPAVAAGLNAAEKGGAAKAEPPLAATLQGLLAKAPAAKRARVDASPERWLEGCQRALAADEAAARARDAARAAAGAEAQATGAAPSYWKIDLPEMAEVLSMPGLIPPGFVPAGRPHVTLLYLGCEGGERAARFDGASPEEVRAAGAALRALEGRSFSVRLVEVVLEENVVCAVVALPPAVPCANRVPHITLATRSGTPARHSNEVLEEFQAGRREGMRIVRLPRPKLLTGRLMLESAGA